MPRILIADDHEIVRQGIRGILQVRSDWEICGEAKNGHEAILLSKDLNPDVIILDVSMPVLGGLPAADEIGRMNPKIKILIFTMDDSKSLRTLVQRCGAAGIVVKSQASNDLVDAVDRLLSGDTYFDPIEEMQPLIGIHNQQVRFIDTKREIAHGLKKTELV